jgi:hypothetical protein
MQGVQLELDAVHQRAPPLRQLDCAPLTCAAADG